MPKPILLSAVAAILAAASANAADETPGILKSADGKAVGNVTLTEGPGGVLVKISGKGLPPGWHGIHFHEKATCADAGFKASGGHVHGGTAPGVHGLLNPRRTDFGDLPNVHVAADGSLDAELYSPLVSLAGAGGRAALKDADGSALVLHAAADDQLTQPIGGAGARIACAVIR